MALRFTGKVGVLASEEEDRPVRFVFFLSCSFLILAVVLYVAALKTHVID